MARIPRRTGPDLFNHVWNRGHRKTYIFIDDQDRFVFLKLMREVFPKYGITVHGYCLLGNHYHLLVYDATGQLSEAMHDVAGSYARYFNNKYELVGSVFQGRFESRPISDDAELAIVSRYIHRNALDVRPDAPIDRYRWSSYPAYVLGTPAHVPVTTSTVLGIIGSPSAYRHFVESQHPSDRENLLELFDPAPARIHPAAENRLGWIEAAIVAWFGSEQVILDASVRGKANDPRLIALLLGAELPGVPQAELACRYGYERISQLTSTLAKSRKRTNSDPQFCFVVEQIRQAAGEQEAASVPGSKPASYAAWGQAPKTA